MATVDGAIEIFRDNNLDSLERKISFVGRDWPDIADEVIRLDDARLLWMPNGKYYEALEMNREAKNQAKAAEVLDVLPPNPPGLTYAELEQRTGLRRQRLTEIINFLGDKIGTSGKKQSRNNPLKFWRKS